MKKSILVSLFIQLGIAQTTNNPDFSIIGDLLVNYEDETTSLSHSGVELAFQEYVNPFARADAYLHLHEGHGLELEEAYLSLERGLPFSLGMRTGVFRPDFGKINKEHAHTYYFIHAPKSTEVLLGEENGSATGAELNLLLPVPWYSSLSVSYMQEGINPHSHSHDHGEEEEHEEEDVDVSPALSSRISSFLDLNTVTHLESGFSYYKTTDEGSHPTFALDSKLKWRPDTYRSLTIQGELFSSVHEEHEEEEEGEHHDEVHRNLSGYVWTNAQFQKHWNAGFILDYIKDLDEETYLGTGFFIGFSPVEESSVYRVYLNRSIHGDEDPVFSVTGQIIWSLGPHKPHTF